MEDEISQQQDDILKSTFTSDLGDAKIKAAKDLDEDIEVLILDPDELDNLISSGDEILDAKTVTAWFRAKQFLDKL